MNKLVKKKKEDDMIDKSALISFIVKIDRVQGMFIFIPNSLFIILRFIIHLIID